MAPPMDEARSRWGSRVEFSATTAKTTSPGWRYFTPSLRASSLQLGGKIEETRTRFWAAIPASRNANSNEVSPSRCFPTPLVKKIRFGTMSLPNSVILRKVNFSVRMHNLTHCFVKEICNSGGGVKKSGKAPETLPAGWSAKELRSSRDRGDAGGVVLLGACHGDVGAGVLVESGRGRFIVGIEGVNLVAHDKSILCSLADADASAAGVVIGLHMLGPAHGIADFSGEGFSFGRE